MDRETEAQEPQEQAISFSDATKAIGAETQMMSRENDDEELADYYSDQDVGMKTEYHARSQSIGISSRLLFDTIHRRIRVAI